MRITSAEKTATRERILEAARELFGKNGFEATTTRQIAVAAEIAAGTLFNYFPTKETIVGALACEALTKARGTFTQQAVPRELGETLFALAAAELRGLKPFRGYLLPLLETSLSPLASRKPSDESQSWRTDHLELVTRLAGHHGNPELSAVALQMYWTLYTGVLAYWAGDASPKQEDTLALLDQSMTMFVAWVRSSSRDTQ
jgi:AcrR family transcriptional regulator